MDSSKKRVQCRRPAFSLVLSLDVGQCWVASALDVNGSMMCYVLRPDFSSFSLPNLLVANFPQILPTQVLTGTRCSTSNDGIASIVVERYRSTLIVAEPGSFKLDASIRHTVNVSKIVYNRHSVPLQ